MTPTRFVIRLAANLTEDGISHPVTAAVARAARIHALAPSEAFAVRLDIDPLTLRRAEAGRLAFDELPAGYLSHLDQLDLDLAGLRQLALAYEPVCHPTRSRYREDNVVSIETRRCGTGSHSRGLRQRTVVVDDCPGRHGGLHAAGHSN